MKKIILLISVSFISIAILYAHGPNKHEKKKQEVKKDTLKTDSVNFNRDIPVITKEDVKVLTGKRDRHISAAFNEFSSLHPLVVHFPIVLIIAAVFMQLGAFFFYKKELSFVTFILLLFGFIGAYIASSYVHPHTAELDEFTAKVLKEHEAYADLTIWFSGIALALKLLSHFFLKRKLGLEIVVGLFLIGAAYFVGMSAHHGSQLVHIEGVGPQGKFLEMDHQH